MPVVIFLALIFALFLNQYEIFFFFNFFYFETIYMSVFNFFFFTINSFNSYFLLNTVFGVDEFQEFSSLKIDYDHNYRTYFTHTYLHAAYNKHMKPYKNLLNTERLFGDYNTRTYGKSKKHARAIKHTKLFMLMYSHTLDCYVFNHKIVSQSSVFFYFKKQHIYSSLEMIYASLYLGMVYFLVFTYVRAIEDGALNNRETEEIDEELAESQWYYFREDRVGVIEPSIDDNEEVNFAYPQHPVEWDDNGHFYRWELHFFIFLFSFLICWGVSQSAASMFFYDNFIDLHFMNWLVTFIFVFIFWRIFFLVQFFSFFNRFFFRRFFYLKLLLPIWSFLISFFFRIFYSYFWPFFYAVFSRNLKIFSLQTLNLNYFKNNLNYMVLKGSLKNVVIRFYRFLYSAYQKNLNFFDKLNFYDYILSSNALFIYNSKIIFDNILYFYNEKDRVFKNILSLTSSFIDNYRLNRGFFFPKNMYFTNIKLLFPFTYVFPVFFPFYLDFYNVNDLPIWGSDFFFSQNQNVFGIAESSEVWFFSQRYFFNFPLVEKTTFKNKNTFYFN